MKKGRFRKQPNQGPQHAETSEVRASSDPHLYLDINATEEDVVTPHGEKITLIRSRLHFPGDGTDPVSHRGEQEQTFSTSWLIYCFKFAIVGVIAYQIFQLMSKSLIRDFEAR